VEVRFIVEDTKDPRVAMERLRLALEEAQREPSTAQTPQVPLFADFAVSLLEEKIHDGSLRSEATKKKWKAVLEHQLIPAFGEVPIDELRRGNLVDWRANVAKRIHDGEYSPHTGNDWLALLRVIMSEAVERYELDHDPIRKLENFDTRTHRTYTREQPNSLRVEQVPDFLAAMARLYPMHFAFVALGFATGLRPSSLRPLRRKGASPDVLWNERTLLIRRSHTEGQVAINMTKTARDQEILLPEELVKILQWHADNLPDGPMRKSDLLFPNEDGGFLIRGFLRTPFESVCKELKLPQKVTPRGMRRTFQDLARAAKLHDFVTRAVSGHATESMHTRYSTVSQAEVHQGLAKVIELTRASLALESAQRSRGVCSQ